MRYMALVLLMLLNGNALADGFRCGTKLILAGDPVTRLTRACGKPDATFKASADIREQGRPKQVSVTQWVYQRGRNRDIIVSIRHGEVVQITRG